MKQLNKLILVLFFLLSSINYAQEFNGYKYIIVSNLLNSRDEYISDYSKISNQISDYFTKKNMIVIKGYDTEKPRELEFNPCLGLFVRVEEFDKWISLQFLNCKKEKIKNIMGKGRNSSEALIPVFEKLDQIPTYAFDEKLIELGVYPIVENINKTESELKSYFDSTKTDAIEGIYKSYKSKSNYKLGIIRDGDFYKAIIIESEFLHWKKGDVKAIFESTAADGVFSTNYIKDDKISLETFSSLEGGLINIEIRNSKGENEDMKLLKLYPKN